MLGAGNLAALNLVGALAFELMSPEEQAGDLAAVAIELAMVKRAEPWPPSVNDD